MKIEMLSLLSVADICTEKQYIKLVDEKPNMGIIPYVRVVDILKRGEDCAFEEEGALPPHNIALFPNGIEIGYLLFILNTYPAQYEMFDRKMNVLTQVRLSKKKLASLEIPIVGIEDQRYFDIARILKNQARKLKTKDETDLEFAELAYGLFHNLCDSLAIELYFEDYLKEEGVEIFKHWKKTVDENLDRGELEAFFKSLVENTSELRNQLMKLRMIPLK